MKMNNNKMFRYHGAIASIFIKGKMDSFNICIANKIFNIYNQGKKVKQLHSRYQLGNSLFYYLWTISQVCTS